jgi:hypothetical protein
MGMALTEYEKAEEQQAKEPGPPPVMPIWLVVYAVILMLITVWWVATRPRWLYYDWEIIRSADELLESTRLASHTGWFFLN